jgi:hypothetical protein
MLLGFLAKCPPRLSAEDMEAAHEKLTQVLLEQQGRMGMMRELWQKAANESALTVLADVARRPVR